MGGVRAASVLVDCDRCKKEVIVTEEAEANFYRAFAKREDPDERMFIGILNAPDGTTTGIDFEYICPKCVASVASYLEKVDIKKKEEPKKGTKAKKNSKAKKEKEEEEDVVTLPPAEAPEAEEKQEEAVEEPAVEEEVGDDYSDDDLFD